ncbi:hypothetical protein [Baekduia sp.]|uniref:hypothetical protein n=1 Tax=Baekduia sp. TaxID=2600305 RepID=UPI002D1F9D62|nr:hypothetical protein [Baekduia sp.]
MTRHLRQAIPTPIRTELARYRISAGERIVYGQRVGGLVRVTDAPGEGGGPRYIVESGLTSEAEVDALISDYVAEAQRCDQIPIRHSPFDEELAA